MARGMFMATFSIAYSAEHTQSDAASCRFVDVSSLCCNKEGGKNIFKYKRKELNFRFHLLNSPALGRESSAVDCWP